MRPYAPADDAGCRKPGMQRAHTFADAHSRRPARGFLEAARVMT